VSVLLCLTLADEAGLRGMLKSRLRLRCDDAQTMRDGEHFLQARDPLTLFI
jgi:hypothetical protein